MLSTMIQIPIYMIFRFSKLFYKQSDSPCTGEKLWHTGLSVLCVRVKVPALWEEEEGLSDVPVPTG